MFLGTGTYGHCTLGTFACNGTEQCIPQHKNCDEVQDCEDGSDEWLCGENTNRTLFKEYSEG